MVLLVYWIPYLKIYFFTSLVCIPGLSLLGLLHAVVHLSKQLVLLLKNNFMLFLSYILPSQRENVVQWW